MQGSAAAGHRNFLPKQRPRAAKQGVKLSSPGFTVLQGKGPRKKA